MSAYTVRELKGCKLITGAVPVDEMSALMGCWPSEWIADGLLAHALKVNFVFGDPPVLATWRTELGLSDQ